MKVTGAGVVVTGAASGIGAATALRFARAGARHVAAVDVDEPAADRTAEVCRQSGGGASAHRCDVADAEAVARLAELVEREHGPVDVLVNNAGVGLGGPFLEHTIEDWDWLRSVNLDGVAYGCHAFGAPMVARGRGHVVNVASGAAYMHSGTLTAYCASKAAVFALSECLRADWSRHGVGVSVICPGVINTGIHTRARLVGGLAARQARIDRAFERFGRSPDVVADAIVRAVERNQAVVPVGIESRLAYRLLPITPGPLKGLLARAEAL